MRNQALCTLPFGCGSYEGEISQSYCSAKCMQVALALSNAVTRLARRRNLAWPRHVLKFVTESGLVQFSSKIKEHHTLHQESNLDSKHLISTSIYPAHHHTCLLLLSHLALILSVNALITYNMCSKTRTPSRLAA